MSTLKTPRVVNGIETTYTDAGTGSRVDLFVFRAQLFAGEYRIAYQAATVWGSGYTSFVVKEGNDSDGKALRQPKHFEVVWTDRGTGGTRDGQLWKAVPHPGYVALSDVAIHRSNSGLYPGVQMGPNEIDPSFMCVHESLVESTELGECLWTDSGSGGRYDGAVWAIDGSLGIRVSRGSSDKPEYEQHLLKCFTGMLYKKMVKVAEHQRVSGEGLGSYKITFTVGQTVSDKVEAGLKAGFSASVGAKVSAGVEGISSGEVSTELTSFMEGHTTFSSETTRTDTVTHEITESLGVGVKLQVYQLHITDSYENTKRPLVDMGTMYTKTVVTPL